ncbi:chromosome segregation ATPase [Bacillus sp. SORGH_AS 510]|uniref:hypothetical protein n=1 Tax=Bacillus sp. SORGH_AS_0510 TaxID=3041771 RepID=UPI00278857C4|nr:hypothetical protein [Bacillus sp. SORGH_AS_0510]MDQ1144017.1 chromosome segregation ATPase [Bacillus sp. SORGH_AS_0510]
MSTAKQGLEEWLEKLQAEKQDAETRLKQAEVNMSLAQIKLSIAKDAKHRVPQSEERQNEFHEKYVKNLEVSYNSHLANNEQNRREIRKEIADLTALISSIQEALPQIDF